MFKPYLDRWELMPDGKPIITPAAHLLPVLWRGQPTMLKFSTNPDQQRGAALLDWWNGDGAADVFERDQTAILMERAEGSQSLSAMARTGQDDEACRILCHAAERLHAPRTHPCPQLVPLDIWFRDLEPVARKYGGILLRCFETAQFLLAEPQDCCVLHGDMHHDNVLDFGSRGWLAIDPHGLVGERGFDFANIFTNPDLSDPSQPVATVPTRFIRRLHVIAEAARLDRFRLLQWILAWTGLSAAWFLGDEDPLAQIDLTVAQLAASELDR